MKRWLVLALLLTGCPQHAKPPPPRQVVDFRGKSVPVAARPERIVSLIPSCTEMLYAVGAGDQVMAVTTFCDYPEAAKNQIKIGALEVNYELLLSLRPDLVLASSVLNRRSVEHLEAAGIPVVCVDPKSLADVARALRFVGEATGHTEEGERAAQDVEERVAAVEARVAGKEPPRVVLELTPDPFVAVPGTYGHDALVRAGGRNAFEELSAGVYVAVSWEAVLAKDPDFYVVAHPNRPRPSERPGFEKLRAVRDGRYVEFDAMWFTYPTPRLVRGLELLSEKLHP
jgi:iron complex transport system substrate-binding protein